MIFGGFCSPSASKTQGPPHIVFGNQFPTFPFINLSNEEGTTELPFQVDWARTNYMMLRVTERLF